MTKFSEKAQAQGDLPALRKRLARAEAITSALIADVELLKQRLVKLEVVRVPSPTVEPDYPARPETE